MRKISPVWKGLYEGYLAVGKSQRQLELEWRRAIQVAENRIHRRRQQDWTAKLASEEKRLRLAKIIGLIIFLFVCSCAAVSTLLPFSFLSWGMAIFISLVLLGMVIVQTAVIENLQKKAPARPAEGRKLLQITEAWWSSLKPPPVEIEVEGDRGEKALLDALEKRLPDPFIALHQFMVLRNLDADIILLGPNGIWLLESKYHSGRVICRNEQWSQEKSYYGKGGIPKKETLPRDPYDGQWLREKEAVTQTILRRLPGNMHWLANEIRGGLVFTHHHVTLEIDPSCQVEYGRIPTWVDRISAHPAVPNLTTGVLLCLVDALLEYANEISTTSSGKSSVQLAADIYSRAENEIPAFVKASL